MVLRECGGGGGYRAVGGQVTFYPYKKGGRKSLAMLKGGTKSIGVVLTRELEVLKWYLESGH